MVPQAEHVSPQEPLPTASRRRPRLPQHRPERSPLPQVLSGRANTLAGSSGVFCVQITSCQAQTGDPQDVEGFSVISESCEKTPSVSAPVLKRRGSSRPAWKPPG